MRLTDRIVKRLPAPARGNKVTYDDAVKGFGVRVTAAGARAFVSTTGASRTDGSAASPSAAIPDWGDGGGARGSQAAQARDRWRCRPDRRA